MLQKLALLGATGSIGKNTLEVVRLHPELYSVDVVTAHTNVSSMLAIIDEFKPKYACMAEASAGDDLRRLIPHDSATVVLSSLDELHRADFYAEIDTVIAAIVGAAGLLPTIGAAKAGKTILLANKESLVMAGELFMDCVGQNKATLLPLDSEHNAIFQCLPHHEPHNKLRGVRQLILTASGGPFRCFSAEQLNEVTPAMACQHPNWEMGRKISIDSASLMNKGLELIEACWLFGVNQSQIDIVVHPQSIVHSMVSYVDGSVLAQLGNPDMRTPIAHALAWPNRIESGVLPLNLIDIGRLDFEAYNSELFPCLNLCRQAFDAGGSATAVLNAANEIAVEAFLQQEISFTDLAPVIDQTLQRLEVIPIENIGHLMSVNDRARQYAWDYVKQIRVLA